MSTMLLPIVLVDESFLLVPCPLSAVVKAQKENVARNFQMLFEYIYEESR